MASPTRLIRNRRGVSRAGVTLIEMLVAIVVIGIMTSIALPRINLEAYKVNSAVRAVTSTLTYAQRLSVTLQHDVVVTFDQGGRRLRMHEDRNNDGTINNNERVTITQLENGVVFSRGATPAHAIGSGALNFTRTQNGFPAVIFRRDGSASESGGFYLNSKRSVAAGTTHEARAGEIVRATGRVVWYRYTTAWTRGD